MLGFSMTGVYSANLHKHYLLLDPDWKDDIVPEIMDGHNIADFVDPDILQRLDELEREEDERAAAAEAAGEDEDMSDEVKHCCVQKSIFISPVCIKEKTVIPIKKSYTIRNNHHRMHVYSIDI
jgi:nucleolar GTP-binding protein